MNSTVNESSCTSPLNPVSTKRKAGATFAYCLVLVVSLVGNSLIAIIVYKTRALRKPINLFIVNMAISDLLYPIFYIPLTLTQVHLGSWLIGGPLGNVLCKLGPFLGDIPVVVSIQSLVLIAVDRFGAVMFPLSSPIFNSRRCAGFIFTTWIIATMVISPYIFAHKLVEYPPGQLVCKSQWRDTFGGSSSDASYFLALYVVFFYIPMILLIILYSIILIKLKSQVIPGEQSVNTGELRANRNRKALRMSVATVLGFAVCWVPFSIINTVRLFSLDNRWPCGTSVYNVLSVVAWLIAYANCAINPCICFAFSENYRRGIKSYLSCFNKVNESTLQRRTRQINFKKTAI